MNMMRRALATTATALCLAAAVATPAFAAGANASGPYDPTVSVESQNGNVRNNNNGKHKAVGRPMTGSVGNADTKNPKGQMPNGTDNNSGYECDANNGIGVGNPAHTSCIKAGAGS